MKKILAGVFIGVILIVAFLYFGGSKYVREFGSKTEETGVKLEKYEKEVKETAKEVKESAEDATEAVGDTIDKTAKKVKEFIP